MENYQKIATDCRKKVLELIYSAQTSHIGSNFSCVDVMTVLFEKIDLNKDKFVLSAGWKAATLYYFLWRKGRITEEQLNSYCREGSLFIGLAEPIIPEIQIAGGSMGLGLPGAVGLALAKKLKGEEGKVYCLMSDGELQTGTFWESLLIASKHKLNNLVVFIDNNRFQAMGFVDNILEMTRTYPIFYYLGCSSYQIDGHKFEEIEGIIDKENSYSPKIVWANTIKGKGVSFMENNNLYHYKQLSEEEYINALKELQNV